MSKYLFLASAVLTIFCADMFAATEDTVIKALSFNIRYGTAKDGDDAWPHRDHLVMQVIRTEDPDFCGLQEAERFQIDAIRNAIPDYAEFGVGRDDGKTKGEYSAILYRQNRWKLLRGNTVWLSDTPQIPGSKSWGNRIPRIVTWAAFADKKTGFEILVFNTHFDHQSQPSRLKSAMAVSRLIADQAGDAPVVLMGDLNAGENNAAIKYLKAENGSEPVRLVDTFRVLHPDAKEVGTFNGFRGRTDGDKIDYVFAKPTTHVKSAEIVRTHEGERYPSDHFPVSAILVFDSGQQQ
jgi:endonuclease/exonuclease/phosphatase family metal-dependent hydrolase